jgi:DNA-binding transcriptional regulator YdaS (Cro superfamily)
MTVRELRGEVAESQVKIYRLAAAVEMHPSRLGQMLRERVPMPPELAMKIRSALRQLAEEAPGA